MSQKVQLSKIKRMKLLYYEWKPYDNLKMTLHDDSIDFFVLVEGNKINFKSKFSRVTNQPLKDSLWLRIWV